MIQDKVTTLILLHCISNLYATYPSFEDYVEYIANYINFTAHYKLPTNNLELYQTCGCEIQGKYSPMIFFPKVKKKVVSDFGVFDFIIIGGGSGGTVLANRLSEVENWDVLLLEAGDIENDFTDIPAMNYYLRTSPMNWGYFTKPQKNSCLGETKIPLKEVLLNQLITVLCY